MNRTQKHYKRKMPIKDEEILQLIVSVIGTSRKGRNKVIKLVQRKNPEVSGSRIRRVYEQSGLSLYKRPRKRIKNQKSNPLTIPLKPMEELGIDFMSDCLDDKRRIRTLNVIDHHNRKCLGIFVDFSLPSIKVIEALERVIDLYGKPKSIRTDNGPEFTSKRFAIWMHKMEIEHIRIQPGKPAQNAIVERFNRTFREDILDANIFYSVANTQEKANDWIEEYNNERPHQSLKYATPNAYAA
jgi:putative transposase